MKFVSKANLPENAKIILIGEKYSEILDKPLKKLGIFPKYVANNPCVDKSLEGHADLSVLHLGGKEIVLAPYLKGSGAALYLEQIGMHIMHAELKQGEKYPDDAALNMCICGNKLIYNPKSAYTQIVENLTIAGFERIEVKQGYSKCSVCTVAEDIIITADEGIHKRAVAAGLESLKIRPGHIELAGYDYGFIGGTAFKIDRETLAFTGHLDEHPDKNLILDFLRLHNINMVYITKNPLFDIGSAIQIVEK